MTGRVTGRSPGRLTGGLDERHDAALMPQPRAADDFKTIRARIEELRRERLPEPAAPSVPAAPLFGHRGPCACGLALFLDECDGSCKAFNGVIED